MKYIPQRAGSSPSKILSTNTSLNKSSFLFEQRDVFNKVDEHVNNMRILIFFQLMIFILIHRINLSSLTIS